MILLSTMTATRSDTNLWIASVYAGVFTAVAALIVVLLSSVPVLWAVAGLLIGAAPVLGYDMARGALGANWRPAIGGVIGSILFVVGLFFPGAAPILIPTLGFVSVAIIWPIAVGAMSPSHSIGTMYLGSLLGLLLAAIVWIIIGLLIGQNPSWVKAGEVFFWSIWGGTCGAALSAWSK